MIGTSSHKNWQTNTYKTYAISGNRGQNVNYKGECYPKLAPKLTFWTIWHDNIGHIPVEENNYFYVQEYYKQVLSKLDPKQVYNELDNSILLCYEEPDEFCHRHIVSAWFELLLGIIVPELKSNGISTIFMTKPNYIKEYLKRLC